jgi:hypothetical protein
VISDETAFEPAIVKVKISRDRRFAASGFTPSIIYIKLICVFFSGIVKLPVFLTRLIGRTTVLFEMIESSAPAAGLRGV